jgi:hypothetical protein
MIDIIPREDYTPMPLLIFLRDNGGKSSAREMKNGKINSKDRS